MTLHEYILSIKNKRIGVIGIGVSNLPLIEKLLSYGCNVTACDGKTEEQLGEAYERLLNMGCKFSLGESYLDKLDFDILFRTPGLMPFDAHLTEFVKKGGELTSEMELFCRLCPCRIIAITGSDGKTTTTTIVYELLKAQGYKVHLGGNIGNPLLCGVDEMAPGDYAVLELSSFQLHGMHCSPFSAVITNISPNHLDKHKDYQDYIDAKASIFAEQNNNALLVLNADNEISAYYAEKVHSCLRYFSRKSEVQNGVYLKDGVILRAHDGVSQPIMNADEILIPGTHNIENYMAAFAACEGLVSDEVCIKTAREFKGVEHRLELVRVKDGVTFINDSIGTSPSRTTAGLHALKTKPILIAGGYDKHIPFDSLGDEICLNAKSLFLCGNTAEKILGCVKASRYYTDDFEIKVLDDFKETVLAATASALEGDIVLLSPACAAFDKFKNFAERGRYFKQIVTEL